MPSEKVSHTQQLHLHFENVTSCRKMPSADVEDLRKQLAAYGQDHVLKFWPRLNCEQRANLVADIQAIDFADLATAFKETVANRENNNQKLDMLLEPIPEELHEGVSRCTSEQLRTYREAGLREVAEGRVAALLLAGGQGTRLGVNYPKGMYDVGLPSHKTLYQLQGERLLKLEELAEELTGKHGTIPWYIMTSEHTMEPTIEFFAKHDYFGLRKENLLVFEQYMLPCLTQEGKIMLETPWKIAKAPGKHPLTFSKSSATGQRSSLGHFRICELWYLYNFIKSFQNDLERMTLPHTSSSIRADERPCQPN
ncbi:UDP-N-acetylhexosamine pyrophosphorylase-like [Uloborus diversus]|uniref:UDP-N-acetylhexosamine pyrophosphorylase-like n=1 Tax=Uloborus diversus TaxID=327109 RepID=UPI0024092CA4|nr:UDP-N-acetylhexosamine pyrophosphorylase-like [Uloborus diversus]